MMLKECYTQEGAVRAVVQGGGGELQARGAIRKFRNQLKVKGHPTKAAQWCVLRDCATGSIIPDGKVLLSALTCRQETIKDKDLTAGKDGNALRVLMIFHFCNLSSRSSR